MKETFNLLRDRLKGNKRAILFILIAVLLLAASATIAYVYVRSYEGVSSTGNISLEEDSSSSISFDVTSLPSTSESSISTSTESSVVSSEEVSTSSVASSVPISSTTTSTPAPSSSSSSVAPPESPSAVVAFYGDSQSDTDAEDTYHLRAVNYMINTGANPVFHVGDVMEDGTQGSLDRFNNVTATLRSIRTFYAALGNNDRVEGDSSTPSPLFLNNFVFPNNEQWYSVNIGNLHVVVLDSAFSASNPTQISWLTADLASSASQSRVTAVMYHHPTFSSTISSYLLGYGVDFVVAGHDHSYQHTVNSGMHSFVTTGQPNIGYILASIYSDSVAITAYNSGNGVIESVSFSER